MRLADGRVAVITGSSQGLGKAFAHSLVAEGAKVVINARTASDVERTVHEIRSKGGTAEGCAVDISTVDGAERLVRTAIEKFGRIDILVNNAGTITRKNLVDMSEEDFDSVVAVNMKGTFACTRAAAPHMIKQRWGRIINVASGAIRGYASHSSYAASKAGQLAMTLTWALELAEYGITCNAIRAATISRLSEVRRKQRAEEAVRKGERPPSSEDLGFFSPEMAAPLVAFLASEQASGVNGQFIGLDGPKLTLWAHSRPVGTVFMPGGWTTEKMLDLFPKTLAPQLESVGVFNAQGKRVI